MLHLDNAFDRDPVVGVPVGSRRDQLFVLNFHNLAQQGESCNLQILAEYFGVQ